jgi:hypothetical protein
MNDDDIAIELVDDVYDQVGAGQLSAAVASDPGRVTMTFGYQLADTFTPDVRFAEVTLSPLEAVALAEALARAAVTAAQDDYDDTPRGFA